MAKNRYYYYDRDACEFREVRQSSFTRYSRLVLIATVVVVVASMLTWGMDRLFRTPQELALMEENEALQQQLETLGTRINSVSDELAELKETDENLYRTLLNADGISDDIRQVGVGGSESYSQFDRFSASTSRILTETSSSLDQLERQLAFQNDSYRELTNLAEEHEDEMAQMPAIFPVNGKVTSGFGLRMHPVLEVRRMHYGLDFHAPVGTPVYATADGVIEQVGRGSGLGRFVKIEHEASGYVTVFAHLSQVPREIRRRRTVSRGDLIGYSGNTGLSNAPHLHYEVRDKDGRSLNPVFFVAPSMTPAEYNRVLTQAENTTYIFD